MEDTKPKTFVFVLMPFHESFGDIYHVGIKPACRDAGAYCERVDEQIFVENILERVYNQIAKADIVVAEMTGRNPNVFYEVGYAHALNKQVILLTQSSDDIPFDLKHYPHIVYGGKIATLKSELEARVRWCIENPKQSLSKVDLDLKFFINGVPLGDKPNVSADNAKQSRSYAYWADINIGVHNPTNKLIHSEFFALALEVPSHFMARIDDPTNTIRSYTPLPNGQKILNLKNFSRPIFPNSWESLVVFFKFERGDVVRKVEMVLRLFTEVGTKDYPFLLSVKLPEVKGGI